MKKSKHGRRTKGDPIALLGPELSAELKAKRRKALREWALKQGGRFAHAATGEELAAQYEKVEDILEALECWTPPN